MISPTSQRIWRSRVYFAGLASMLMILSTIPIVAFCGGYGDYPIPANEDWIISEDTSVWDENILVDGNITVQADAALLLTNVTLFVNSTTDGEFTIEIESGGALYANNVLIVPYDDSYRFKFEAYGHISLCNTVVSHIWGDDDLGGLRIYDDEPWLENLTVMDSGGPGIYMDSAYPSLSHVYISNTTYGIYCTGSAPSAPFENLQVVNATIEACHFDSCDIELAHASISDSPVGLNSTSSSLYISSSGILNTSGYSLIVQSSSSVTCQDTVFNRDRIDVSVDSAFIVGYSFDMTLIDANHNPVQDRPVTISEWAGNPVYFGMTDQQGRIPNQQLNDFTIVGGMKTYCTPHLIWIMGNPYENKFYIAAEKETNITVFCDGDADNDTIRDIEERSEYLFMFEAEARAYMPGQVVNDQANANISTIGQVDGAAIIDERLISLNPAYYTVFVKARQTVANTTESLYVSASDGSSTLASDEFSLANNTRYNWYSLDEVQIQSPSELRLNLSNANASSRNILVESILIVRTKDETGTPTFSGYFSLPLRNDSDQDGLYDGFDINDVANGEVSIGTNPMDGDTDDDMLWDGDEVNGYFPEDRLEAEDCANAIGDVYKRQFSVVFETDYSDIQPTQFSVNLTIPDQNLYRFKLNGWGDIRLQGAEMGDSAIWGPAENATATAVEFELRTSAGDLVQPTDTYKDLERRLRLYGA